MKPKIRSVMLIREHLKLILNLVEALNVGFGDFIVAWISDWGLLEALPTNSALENMEMSSYVVNNNYL